MAGISVPVPSVNDGAIADRLGPPSESGRELQPRGFFTGSLPRDLSELGGGLKNEISSMAGFGVAGLKLRRPTPNGLWEKCFSQKIN